jgi:nitrite reductase/ring-hydroxylating ferredoxin subunit
MTIGQDVCAAAEILPGEAKCVLLDEKRILLARVDDRIYAVSDVCSHACAYLSEGFLDGTIVECPLHGAQFDVTTGKVLSPPADRDIETYNVTVTDGRVFVACT